MYEFIYYKFKYCVSEPDTEGGQAQGMPTENYEEERCLRTESTTLSRHMSPKDEENTCR